MFFLLLQNYRKHAFWKSRVMYLFYTVKLIRELISNVLKIVECCAYEYRHLMNCFVYAFFLRCSNKLVFNFVLSFVSSFGAFGAAVDRSLFFDHRLNDCVQIILPFFGHFLSLHIIIFILDVAAYFKQRWFTNLCSCATQYFLVRQCFLSHSKGVFLSFPGLFSSNEYQKPAFFPKMIDLNVTFK